MSFLLDHTTLTEDITNYIYQFTQPKKIDSYSDNLIWTITDKHGYSYFTQLFQSEKPDFDYTQFSRMNVFSKNIGYYGYSLLIGYTSLKYYPQSLKNLRMILIFDEFLAVSRLMAKEIVIVDSQNKIIDSWFISDNWVLSGVFSKRQTFYYSINQKNKINDLELENWINLIDNTSVIANNYITKHFQNKITLSYNYIEN